MVRVIVGANVSISFRVRVSGRVAGASVQSVRVVNPH